MRRSADQITERYPDLTVITGWRDWMTPERLLPLASTIQPEMVFDIDHPDGYLARYEEPDRPPST